jgi:nitrite reductase (cytochrome c-552)
MNCHASTYVPMMKLGNGDIMKGFEKMNQMPYQEARKLVTHPVTCIDCHDSADDGVADHAAGIRRGYPRVKASQGIENYDVHTMASRQEMRAFVCGQCHVEYYFQGPEKRLTFPWANGVRADEMLQYYEENPHDDWTHADTGAKVLKAQHPEFEMWRQGIHGRSGVTCADCHMPYMRVGAMKISDHHVRSPVLNINNACQTCHKWPEEELRERIYTIQDRTFDMRNRAMEALVALINDIKAAIGNGVSDADLEIARKLQRRAQFMVDYVEAENSMGFHAPGEAARLLAESIDYARQGQLAVRGVAVPGAQTTQKARPLGGGH